MPYHLATMTRLHSSPLLPSLLLVCVLSLVLLAGKSNPTNNAPNAPGDGAMPPPQPGPLSDARFGAVAVGRFHADLGLDAVVFDDGVPTLCINPETMQTSVRWSGGAANDLVAHPRGDGTDRLFVVAASGLHELVWDFASNAWLTLDHELDAWRGARAVADADVDGDGDLDLLGLSSGSAGVLVLLGDGAGGWTPGAAFPTYFAANDVLAVDWDGDGADEIAVVSAGGVEIFSGGGADVAFVPWTASPLYVEVLDDPATTAQKLALVLAGPSATYVRVVGRDESEAVTSLGNLGVVSVTGADMDGDGDTDLLLSITASNHVGSIAFRSDLEPGGPFSKAFAANSLVLLPFGDLARNPAGNLAGVDAADFDHDGELEVFAPAQGDFTGGAASTVPYSRIVLIDDDSAHEAALTPGLVSIQDSIVAGDEVVTAWRTYEIAGPTQQLPTTAGQQLRLHATLWRAPGLWGDLEPLPWMLLDVPLPPAGEVVPLTVPKADLPDLWADLHGWVYRQVVVQDGSVVARGPANVTLSGHNAAPTLRSQVSLPSITIPNLPAPGGTGGADGGTDTGASLPRDPAGQPPPSNSPAGGR